MENIELKIKLLEQRDEIGKLKKENENNKNEMETLKKINENYKNKIKKLKEKIKRLKLDI